MSLSLKAIDRLFQRLNATYGSDFLGRYKGTPDNDIKTVWAHELGGFEDHLHSMAWALDNLPERAPNVVEFRNLCRKAPAADVPKLPEPKADLARVAAELAKLAPTRAAIVNGAPFDHRAWAYRLQARDESGEILNMTVKTFYRQALGLEA